MNKKKVLAITGIRSEYDILYPVINNLRNDNSFDVKIIVSGSHLSDWHGNTYHKILDDKFEICEKIDSLFLTNRVTQRVKGVGILTYSLSQTIEREAPDFLIVVGDREESIAAALVGNYMNILTVHLAGGDPVWGNTDDPIRMAVSKLAHIHFTFCEEYALNLVKIGEEKFRIFNTGNPSLENIKNTPQITLQCLSKELDYDISDGNYLIFIKHPLSSEFEDAFSQMENALKGIESFCLKYNYKVIATYPNTDPGSTSILEVISTVQNKQWIKFYKTIEREKFINIVRNAKAIVGNSSMGILEAPFYKLPTVNIGNRQRGRLTAGNVEYTDYKVESILAALEKACFNQSYRYEVAKEYNKFGNGSSSDQINNILKSIDPKSHKWLIKQKLC